MLHVIPSMSVFSYYVMPLVASLLINEQLKANNQNKPQRKSITMSCYWTINISLYTPFQLVNTGPNQTTAAVFLKQSSVLVFLLCTCIQQTSSNLPYMLRVPFDVVLFCSLSFQHTLTSTADLVLERLAQRVSALTAGSELESAKAQDTEEKDVPAKREQCAAQTN